MKHHETGAQKRRTLSLRCGAAPRPAEVGTVPAAATIIPPHELRRLVAAMID